MQLDKISICDIDLKYIYIRYVYIKGIYNTNAYISSINAMGHWKKIFLIILNLENEAIFFGYDYEFIFICIYILNFICILKPIYKCMIIFKLLFIYVFLWFYDYFLFNYYDQRFNYL